MHVSDKYDVAKNSHTDNLINCRAYVDPRRGQWLSLLQTLYDKIHVLYRIGYTGDTDHYFYMPIFTEIPLYTVSRT